MIEVFLADVSSLEDEKLFRYYYEKMPSVRKNKIDAYKFDKDKRLSLGAGILVGRAFAELCEKRAEVYGDRVITEDDVIILDGGKPEIPGICFSISHSGQMAILAMSDELVGCDIELKRDATKGIAESYFADDEVAYLKGIAGEAARKDAFFDIWTKKESYIKATGEGLSRSLDSFSVLQMKENFVTIDEYEDYAISIYTCGDLDVSITQIDFAKDIDLL